MLIGEVAERSGVSARMLRHYDRIGLVSPSGRSAGGYRRYAADDVRRLFQVEGLRALGLTLEEVGDVLADLAYSPAEVVRQLLARTRERLAREQDLLDRLERVRSSDPSAWTDVLSTIALVRGLEAGTPSARQRSALSLGEDGRHAALLAEAVLGEDDPVVAGALHWALARTGDAAVPTLAEALGSPELDRRQRALAALTKMASGPALDALAGAVASGDPLVAARATLTRGRRGDADAVGGLVALVVTGRDDVEATDVLHALAVERGLADTVTRAVEDRLRGADVPARQRLATVLAGVPGPGARAGLTALLDDPDEHVAGTAGFLLREGLPGP